jgi:multidrug efflux pump subunit AcrB
LRFGGLLKRWRWERALERFVSSRVLGPVQEFFARAVKVALRRPLPFLLPAVMMLVLTGRVLIPLVGKDLMPPMDTGIFRVTFEAYPNTSLSRTEELLGEAEKIVWDQGGVVRTASALGSEPGVLSFGSGRNPQQAFITVHLVDRFHRDQSLWQVEDAILRRLSEIPGLRYPAVFDYGATPLSTIRSTVDLVLSGPDSRVLDRLARDVEERLRKAGGVRAVVRTWTLDREELHFAPAVESLSLAGADASSLAAQLGAQVQGSPATLFRIPQQDSFPVWLQASAARRAREGDLGTLPILTASGPVPLLSLGTMHRAVVPTLHTRQNLTETVDVLGSRGVDAVTHIGANVDRALAGLDLPPGYTLTDEGERKAMDESFSALMAALLLGLVFLYFALVPAFRSFLHPLTIMVAIPLGLIGASWVMLVTGKHQCMPSFLGLILLAGIVVKNSILLVDFTLEARARGASIPDALVEAVRVRTRPILMTAATTAVGMLPIALERAIGLERLSPLAVVAIGGLVVSTFLTLLYVPLVYDLLERARARLARAFAPARVAEPGDGR